MSTPTHDPPRAETSPVRNAEPDLSAFEGDRFEKYRFMRDRLGREPIDLIAELRLKGRVRVRAGRPMVDEHGNELIALPPFREIAPRVSQITGVHITHETARRWWELAWPNGHPDEPPTVGVTADAVRKAIRAARENRAGAANPGVPPAVFVAPPTDG